MNMHDIEGARQPVTKYEIIICKYCNETQTVNNEPCHNCSRIIDELSVEWRKNDR